MGLYYGNNKINGVYVGASGGGYNVPQSSVAVVDNAVVSDGAIISAQPTIIDGEMSATSNTGLAFKNAPNIAAVIELDYTLNSSTPAGLLLSFGGSNTNGGVLTLTGSLFQYYGNGLDLRQSLTISPGVRYRLKIEINSTTLKLYVDGMLIATFTNNRFVDVLSYIADKSKNLALLWNQSWHGEYNTSKVNNLSVKMVADII